MIYLCNGDLSRILAESEKKKSDVSLIEASDQITVLEEMEKQRIWKEDLSSLQRE